MIHGKWVVLVVGFTLLNSSHAQNAEGYFTSVKKLVDIVQNAKQAKLHAIRTIIQQNKNSYILDEEEMLLNYTYTLRDSLYSNKVKPSSIEKIFAKFIPDKVSAKEAIAQAQYVAGLNHILISLLQYKAINKDSLNTVNNEGKLFEVLNKIDPHDGENIADIGAGSGFLVFLLYLSPINANLYYNDIEESYCNFAKRFFEDYLKLDANQKTITFIKGSDESTEIEKVKLDKVILMNALHHFDKEELMIKSIRKSMKSNTALFLIENPSGMIKDQTDPDKDCRRALPERDIRIALKINELSIVEEYKIFEKSIFWKIGL